MNYDAGDWYNELYRLFSDDVLLTQEQTVKLGQCLRKIQSGENAEYHLNELYYAVQGNSKLEEGLDRLIHAYIKHLEEVKHDEETDNTPFAGYEFVGSLY